MDATLVKIIIVCRRSSWNAGLAREKKNERVRAKVFPRRDSTPIDFLSLFLSLLVCNSHLSLT